MGATQGKHQFCWECNGLDASEACSKCARTFHTDCVSKDRLKGADSLCAVCTRLKASEYIDKAKTLNMLPILIETVKATRQFISFETGLNEVNQSESAGVSSISEAINKASDKEFIQSYKSFDEFFTDVQWILNNYSKLFEGDRKKTDAAKCLMEFIDAEIKGLKMCTECYLNATQYPDQWFTMVCAQPHLLIKAKVGKRATRWPAKLMSISGKKVNARFFGDHTNAEISAAKCFLYSNEKIKKRSENGVGFKAALKETNLYIENIRKKFGSFNAAETATPIDPTLLAKYTTQMISRPEKCTEINHKKRINVQNTGADECESSEYEDDIISLSSDSDDDDEPIEKSNNKTRRLSILLTDHGQNVDINVNSKGMERGDEHKEKDGHRAEKRVQFSDHVQYYHIESSAFQSDDSADGDEADGVGNGYSDKNEPENNPKITCKQIMNDGVKKSTEAFELMCELNTILDNKLKRKYEEIKDLCEQKDALISKVEKLTTDIGIKSKCINEYKARNKQLEVEKGILLGEIEQAGQRVEEAKRLCKKRCSSYLEQVKKMKICVACDAMKPQDTLYTCNDNCLKRYCETLMD